jgi:hypothetical protein
MNETSISFWRVLESVYPDREAMDSAPEPVFNAVSHLAKNMLLERLGVDMGGDGLFGRSNLAKAYVTAGLAPGMNAALEKAKAVSDTLQAAIAAQVGKPR